MTELGEMVEELKPTALIGAAAIPAVFTEEIVRTMAKLNDKPIIFALSNPTSKAECTAEQARKPLYYLLTNSVYPSLMNLLEQAYTWSEGRAVFASGSPFPAFELNGQRFEPGQGNNAYIFPGVALGVMFSGIKHVSDDVFLASAEVRMNSLASVTVSIKICLLFFRPSLSK